MNPADRVLSSGLRGDLSPLDGVAVEALVEGAHRHGISSLLHDALERSGRASSFPQALREALKRRALAAAAVELARRQELTRLLGLMAEAGIEPILMKGTALAYSHYPQPSLRERGDTDLLIAARDQTALFCLLEAQGFARPNAVSGELASSEASFSRTGSTLVLDIHWRVSNSPLLSPALDFEQARSRAVALPALGPHARGLGAVDALLLAATHRATHHVAPYYVGDTPHRGDRLIWLYDLHLLAPTLTPQQWGDLTDRAGRHRVAGLCLDAFRCTHEAFGTVFPAAVLQTLTQAAQQREPAMVFLQGGALRLLVAELGAPPTWRGRWRLLREHAFPPAAYMLCKYETNRRWLLPALYVRRALGWLAK